MSPTKPREPAPARPAATDEIPPRPHKLFWFGFALIVALGVGLRIWLFVTTHFTVGDAFITFRFAEQFAAGHGLVFNTGEWVGGNTSVLHSFLLGLGSCSGVDVGTVARIQGILYDVGAVFILLNIVRGTGGLRAPSIQLMAVAFVFFCPFLFWYSISGLETSLYLALLFFLIARTLEKLDAVWLMGVALLFFCRPDGVLAVAVALGFVTMRHRKIPWSPALGVFVIGLVYLAFNYFVYHSLIPPTVKVKGLVYHDSFGVKMDYISNRFFFHRHWLLETYVVGLMGLMLLRKNNPKVLLLGFTALIYLLFVLTAPTLRTWYVAPFLSLSAIAFLLGLLGLLEETIPQRATVITSACFAGYLVVCLAVAYPKLQNECSNWHQRSLQLTDAEGNWYKHNTPVDTKILVETLETGYFCNRHIWDWPGLVSPPVLELVKQNPKIGMFELAQRLKVNYVTIHSHWNPADETNIPPNFIKVATFQTAIVSKDMIGTEGLDYIYQRQSE